MRGIEHGSPDLLREEGMSATEEKRKLGRRVSETNVAHHTFLSALDFSSSSRNSFYLKVQRDRDATALIAGSFLFMTPWGC